ncbi:rRNA maturation RNase YbeY [Lichenihabitans psoromatis]|uniref:rRNA maturation RNase YbeY n=1 Tax=Lichenihabitans psoromatis TaxID=2528642 RepID=UPI00103666DB|nr:rRNA maturation RNase YbeY [Lichenihabitans psoromatis]
MTIEIDIAIDSPGWSVLPDLDAIVRRSIDGAAAAVDLDAPQGAEVSILFCDDAAIQVLNREWRQKDKPTNVLSFPAAQPEGIDGPELLGDIAVALETTRREAEQDGKTLSDHVSHLLVHGFLHLIDYDHETADEAEAMEQLETRILANLGIGDPYAGTEVDEVARP